MARFAPLPLQWKQTIARRSYRIRLGRIARVFRVVDHSRISWVESFGHALPNQLLNENAGSKVGSRRAKQKPAAGLQEGAGHLDRMGRKLERKSLQTKHFWHFAIT